mmetsp:Transcript_71603/g.232815  ORF Transcript_71603/g.232815 Transcript_71603/m.232815 type:complete len:222 (-) Transcript_71603:112-777(-)
MMLGGRVRSRAFADIALTAPHARRNEEPAAGASCPRPAAVQGRLVASCGSRGRDVSIRLTSPRGGPRIGVGSCRIAGDSQRASRFLREARSPSWRTTAPFARALPWSPAARRPCASTWACRCPSSGGGAGGAPGRAARRRRGPGRRRVRRTAKRMALTTEDVGPPAPLLRTEARTRARTTTWTAANRSPRRRTRATKRAVAWCPFRSTAGCNGCPWRSWPH